MFLRVFLNSTYYPNLRPYKRTNFNTTSSLAHFLAIVSTTKVTNVLALMVVPQQM